MKLLITPNYPFLAMISVRKEFILMKVEPLSFDIVFPFSLHDLSIEKKIALRQVTRLRELWWFLKSQILRLPVTVVPPFQCDLVSTYLLPTIPVILHDASFENTHLVHFIIYTMACSATLHFLLFLSFFFWVRWKTFSYCTHLASNCPFLKFIGFHLCF